MMRLWLMSCMVLLASFFVKLGNSNATPLAPLTIKTEDRHFLCLHEISLPDVNYDQAEENDLGDAIFILITTGKILSGGITTAVLTEVISYSATEIVIDILNSGSQAADSIIGSILSNAGQTAKEICTKIGVKQCIKSIDPKVFADAFINTMKENAKSDIFEFLASIVVKYIVSPPEMELRIVSQDGDIHLKHIYNFSKRDIKDGVYFDKLKYSSANCIAYGHVHPQYVYVEVYDNDKTISNAQPRQLIASTKIEVKSSNQINEVNIKMTGDFKSNDDMVQVKYSMKKIRR